MKDLVLSLQGPLLGKRQSRHAIKVADKHGVLERGKVADVRLVVLGVETQSEAMRLGGDGDLGAEVANALDLVALPVEEIDARSDGGNPGRGEICSECLKERRKNEPSGVVGAGPTGEDDRKLKVLAGYDALGLDHGDVELSPGENCR